MSRRGVAEQLRALFDPESIAVIGASNNRIKWGHIVPANIVAGGYQGRLYPVNPHEDEILDRKVYRSLGDIPEQVDLVVITIPANLVAGAIEECVRFGAKAGVVISGGFSEVGGEGEKLERDLLRIVEGSSFRFCGPNTMGVYSSASSLHALMPPVRPVAGKIGFAAQSGNLGTQMLSLGKALGVGYSRFACIGNEADLHCEDYVEYFAEDPETEVILLYIEGLRNARDFLDITKSTSSRKPIIVYKAGRTGAGARAARSHSAALAGSQDLFEAVLKQAGMIEAETTEEMLDIAKAFAAVPLPRGRRVGVLTWGGGWGVVTADALAGHGLELVQLPEETLKQLDAVLPPYWSRGNPVDLVGTLDLSKHFTCIEILARCPDVDAVITLGTMGSTSSFQSFVMEESGMKEEEVRAIAGEFMEQIQAMDNAYRDTVISLIKETQKPIMAVSFPTSGAISPMLARQSEVVIYPAPERAAMTLAALYRYRRFLESETG